MDKNCLGCSYYMKGNRDSKFQVAEKERIIAMKNNFSFVNNWDSLACYRGIWDEGLTPDLRKKRFEMAKKCCQFFYSFKYGKNKLFQTCIEEQRASKEKKVFCWTVVGTIAAIMAAVAGILGLLNK